MSSREDASRIAKILARALSPEAGEAATAVEAAYKRMRRDQVTVKQLLSLPLQELYQEALVKLVMHILGQQDDLSPGERRKAFENYMALISARFAEGEEGAASDNSEQEKAKRSREEERKQHEAEAARRAEEQKRRMAEEQARRAAEEQARRTAEAAGNRTSQANKGESMNRPPPEESAGYGRWVALLGIIALIAIAALNSKGERGLPDSQVAVAQAPTSTPSSLQAELAVAALNVNLRERPEAKSKVLRTLSRGEAVKLVSEPGLFAEVELNNGGRGFIAREMLISTSDARRLSEISARDYLSQRADEKRIDAVLAQLEPNKASFVAAIGSILHQSDEVYRYLDQLDAGMRLDMSIDAAAATWFSLAAKYFESVGKLEEACLQARAAIEADPANANHYVAFALCSYKQGVISDVQPPSLLLPRLAPYSTNSWMMLAVSATLKESPGEDDGFAKYALVLAMRLSKNLAVTRKYFSEMAKTAPHERTRQAFIDALEEERQRPDLFARPAVHDTSLR